MPKNLFILNTRITSLQLYNATIIRIIDPTELWSSADNTHTHILGLHLNNDIFTTTAGKLEFKFNDRALKKRERPNNFDFFDTGFVVRDRDRERND